MRLLRLGFLLYWRWKSTWAKRGRPKVTREVLDLIRRMSRENPTWGAQRIADELALLGYDVCVATVAKFMVRVPKPPSQTWRTFLAKPLRKRGIQPFIAKRNTEHGSGLGKHRWVIEGVFSWLFKQRRLRVRYEKRDDIHSALLMLGCLLICWNRLSGFC